MIPAPPAEAAGLEIDLPEVSGRAHHALELPAMDQSGGVPELMDDLLPEAVEEARMICRHAVELVREPVHGDDRRPAPELRLAENECEHRNEEVDVDDRNPLHILRSEEHTSELQSRLHLVC